MSSSFSVTEELFVVEEHTKSLVVVEAEEEAEAEEKTKVDNEADEQKLESEGWAVFRADGIQFQLNLKQRVERERKEKDAEEEEGGEVERYFIGEWRVLHNTTVTQPLLENAHVGDF